MTPFEPEFRDGRPVWINREPWKPKAASAELAKLVAEKAEPHILSDLLTAYAYAIQEIPSAQARKAKESLPNLADAAIRAIRTAETKTRRLLTTPVVDVGRERTLQEAIESLKEARHSLEGFKLHTTADLEWTTFQKLVAYCREATGRWCDRELATLLFEIAHGPERTAEAMEDSARLEGIVKAHCERRRRWEEQLGIESAAVLNRLDRVVNQMWVDKRRDQDQDRD